MYENLFKETHVCEKAPLDTDLHLYTYMCIKTHASKHAHKIAYPLPLPIAPAPSCERTPVKRGCQGHWPRWRPKIVDSWPPYCDCPKLRRVGALSAGPSKNVWGLARSTPRFNRNGPKPTPGDGRSNQRYPCITLFDDSLQGGRVARAARRFPPLARMKKQRQTLPLCQCRNDSRRQSDSRVCKATN